MRIVQCVFVVLLLARPASADLAKHDDAPRKNADRTEYVLSKLREKDPDLDTGSCYLLRDGTEPPGVRLDLNDARFDDSDLAMLKYVANLHELDLLKATVTDAGMAHIANLKGLWSLSLDKTSVGDEGLKTLHRLKALRHLSLQDTRVTGKGIHTLGELPRLRWIYASGAPVEKLLLNDHFPSLEEIDLSDCPLQEVRLSGLPHLSELRLISQGLSRVHLRSLPELRELAICRDDGGGLQPRGHVELRLQDLPQVTFLRIHARIHASDLNSLDAMQNLKKLSIAGGDADGNFLQRIANLPCLTVLQLGYMENVTNKDLATLAECGHLSTLDLGWGGGYNGDVLQHLAGLTQLTHLDFDPATPLTNEQPRISSTCTISAHSN